MRLRYYFVPILSFILLFLILVPIGIYSSNLVLAKTCGFLTLISTVIALRYWFFVLRRNSKRNPIVKLTINDLHSLKQSFPFLNLWNSESQSIIQGRIGIVLSEVRFLIENEDVSREEAINFSFVLACKYINEDFLPIAKSIVSCDTLSPFVRTLQEKGNLSFEDCIILCADAEIVSTYAKS